MQPLFSPNQRPSFFMVENDKTPDPRVGRFRGFILYETSNFIDFFPDGTATNTWPEIDALAADGS